MDFVIHEGDDAAELAACLLEDAGYRVWVANGSLSGIPKGAVALYTSARRFPERTRDSRQNQRNRFLMVGPDAGVAPPQHDHEIMARFYDRVAIAPREDLAYKGTLPHFKYALLRMARDLFQTFPGEERIRDRAVPCF